MTKSRDPPTRDAPPLEKEKVAAQSPLVCGAHVTGSIVKLDSLVTMPVKLHADVRQESAPGPNGPRSHSTSWYRVSDLPSAKTVTTAIPDHHPRNASFGSGSLPQPETNAAIRSSGLFIRLPFGRIFASSHISATALRRPLDASARRRIRRTASQPAPRLRAQQLPARARAAARADTWGNGSTSRAAPADQRGTRDTASARTHSSSASSAPHSSSTAHA